MAALLESQDVAINTRTPEGWTALVAAADKGHHGLVRTLLKHQGTDVNIRDNQSKSSLESFEMNKKRFYFFFYQAYP